MPLRCVAPLSSLSLLPPPPPPALLPYTTLFRSGAARSHRRKSTCRSRRSRTRSRIAPPSVPCRLHRASHSRERDRKSTRLNSSHLVISYAVFCLKKKNRRTVKPLERASKGYQRA